MEQWEKKLDRVIERVLAGDDMSAEGPQTTSDSDRSVNGPAVGTEQEVDEREAYAEMCALLDSTLRLTVKTIMNASDIEGNVDPTYCAAVDNVWKSQNEGINCAQMVNVHEDVYSDESSDDGDDDDSDCAATDSSSVPSLTLVELCLSKRRIQDLEMENHLHKNEIVRLHDILNAATIRFDNRTCTNCNHNQHADETGAHDTEDLIKDLIETKCALALALSAVEEEKLSRFKILHAMDKILL